MGKSVYQETDVNKMFNSFLRTFLNIFNASFTVKYKSTNEKHNWITRGIKISCKQKRNLYALTNYSKDPVRNAHYNTYCKIVRKVIREAKKQHYSRLIAQSNNKIKTTWNIIKKETGKVHPAEQIPSLLVDNKKLNDPKSVANAFKNFFLNITENLDINHKGKGDAISFLKDSFPINFPSLKIIPISEPEIRIIINSLKAKNSSGYDEISSKILKACSTLISYPLSYIYNHSLLTGTVPDRLKIAIVKPLFKKGDKIIMTNYRPVSLLPSFSKVLEKAMYNRLSHHLHMNNIPVTEQHGFRNGISTEKAAFRRTNSVFQSLNKKRHVGGIFCALAKAFDCVNHDILLFKLHFYGIQGETADWFRSYLSNIKQRAEAEFSNS
ncbi:hypothetical protein Cfor_11239 [Coptotermes formosanus]|uniref:Reverse transcriptase domain-containing protein n=1 Tax=Coptotermes formosanus TaxID=36987 RepID=A0A6L2Q255_COPFO|nr:hypothetical protein Cfor_11239 [Coptotermes formosanus]